MKIIKTREELAGLVDKNKDLVVDDDVLMEFSPTRDEIRDVTCWDLTLKKDSVFFDFNGRNFTGGDFNGRNFTGGNFNGGNINYHAFFCCYGKIIKHGKIYGRHPKAHPPIEIGKEQK